jgi:HK97 family phage prohead protease
MKIVTERLKFADLFPEQASKLAQKLHIKKDEIPFIRKFYTSEKAEVDKKERSVVSYISTIAKDRDGEQLLPGGVTLDNYRKNPVVLYGHDYHSIPIGKNIWITEDEKGLKAKTVFAKSEFADQIYRAYTEDIEGTGPLLKAWSVGFIPKKWEEPKEKDGEDAPRRIYTEWELLEYSAVPIPSCPEALTLAYQKGLIPEALREDLQEDVEDLEITIDDDPDITIDPDIEPTKEATVDEAIEEVLDLDPTEKRIEEAIEETKEEPVQEIEIDGEKLVVGIGDDLPEHIMKEIREELTMLKEGREISTKNRKTLADIAESMQKVIIMIHELLDNTKPPSGEEEKTPRVQIPDKPDPDLIDIQTDDPDKEIDISDLDEKIAKAVEKALSADKIKGAIKEGVDISIKKMRGKVE